MGTFRWISAGDIPAHCDLRLSGWRLLTPPECEGARIALVRATSVGVADWPLPSHSPSDARRLTLVVGVADPEDRARLLSCGYGDVVADDMPLAELGARAWRLSAHSRWVPRQRVVGPLHLDLLNREATCHGRPLGLHPLEFGLLWRLADSGEEGVSREALVRDVWRFSVTNNSIAVQVSRLRRKLSSLGLGDLVETTFGGYRLLSCLREEEGTLRRAVG